MKNDDKVSREEIPDELMGWRLEYFDQHGKMPPTTYPNKTIANFAEQRQEVGRQYIGGSGYRRRSTINFNDN